MVALYIRELDIKGGTHKQFFNLADYLNRNGVEFKIITSSYNLAKTYQSFISLESKIVLVNRKLSKNYIFKIYYYVRFLVRLRKELKGISVINIHDNGLQLLFPFLADKKIIWQINDLPIEFRTGVNKGDSSNIFKQIKQFYIKWTTKWFVNKITVNVKKNKERIFDIFEIDTAILYCGIEKVKVKKDYNVSFERFSKKKVNLLSSGVFLPYRNYETLICVVRDLLTKNIDVKLDIIGSTNLNLPYTSKIQKLIKQEGLESNINILGQISEKRFLELHQGADIFLFVNIDQSWGLAVFEAMSCGIPVIVSENVGAVEILQNGQNAIFVNPLGSFEICNKIHELMSNKMEYLKYFNNGISFADKYTWDNSYSSKVLDIIINISKEPV